MSSESLVTDLLMDMASQLTFQDIVELLSDDYKPGLVSVLQDALVGFVGKRGLKGTGDAMDSQHALESITADWFIQTVGFEYKDEGDLNRTFLGASSRPSLREGRHGL